MPQPPTYRIGSSIPSSSSSSTSTAPSSTLATDPTTAFDRAKASLEVLDPTRANIALLAGGRQQQQQPQTEVPNRALKDIIEQYQLEAIAEKGETRLDKLDQDHKEAGEAKSEADELQKRIEQLARERDEVLEREKRREGIPNRVVVALLLEDFDKSNSARTAVQTQLDWALPKLAEARFKFSSITSKGVGGGGTEREREMAEADRLILQGRLDDVETEKWRTEERLRGEV
ncbi:hypothetical protein Rt10032_c22g6620 [Rhodotorula toruloides]|uniref:Uncharacterized protein n=1 Tax=Rhodotorula toruloides TaxID=5286 RepID=A0A511KQI1_RHOTO|nr:hypothetical protein Rt10032_c22g6620 [Rhodotorula toruloides]